jgi:hypothetical protein
LLLIYFEANNKSQSGKWIPLDKDTGNHINVNSEHTKEIALNTYYNYVTNVCVSALITVILAAILVSSFQE